MLKLQTLLRCFFRSYCIGANFNTKGLQNIGLSFAMDPGLQKIYTNPEELRQARIRYLGLFNCHPYWTPLLVGYFLFLEVKIARKVISEDTFKNVKTTATYTLSAIGDSFFSGSFLVFWSLILILLLKLEMRAWALMWFAVWFCCLQLFKLYIFWQGWTRGLTFFQGLKRMNLINWGQRLKYFNAGLLPAIWLLVFPNLQHPVLVGSACVLTGICVWVLWKRWLSREFLLTGYCIVLYAWFILL